ncbi:MAG: class I SAM-dependent methyltransferase [candidate division Zixibacteria bacterium]|nr:class I SAM-dependent methyltransferase [candidate division Zixibacteria bacterium]
MIPYDQFSTVYDMIGHDRFSISMAEYALEIMKRFKVEPHDALDLCCGTGSAVRVFADQGIAMCGLDRSPQMLVIARQKLQDRHVKLYRQELPHFEIKTTTSGKRSSVQQFDLVTCFFDSLNYLRDERQLRATFKAVRRHLRPGGWFIFDMNTPYHLKTVFTDQKPYAGVNDNVAWIFRNGSTNTPDSADLLLTFFVKRGKRWERFDEIHRERAYSNPAIAAALRDAGLQVKGMYRCLSFERPTRKTMRVCFVVRRAG